MGLFKKKKSKKEKKDLSGYTPSDYEKALTDLDEEKSDDFFGNKSYTENASTVSAILKAIIYIAFIIVVSGALAYFILTSLNDVFAFVKDDRSAEVTIPEYATSADIAEALAEKEIINHPWLFKLYSKLKKVDSEGSRYDFVAGTYTVSANMNYDELLIAFVKKSVITTVRVTIPEGYTVDDIINLFLEKGIDPRKRGQILSP